MRLLSRGETAAKLGLSIWSLRHYEDTGRIKPVNPQKGVPRRYTEHEIARFISEEGRSPMPMRSKSVHKVTAQAELAASVFDLLAAGLTKIEIVQRLRAHPDDVDAIALKYEKMRREQEDGTSLPAPCVKCGDSAARFCGGCVDAAPTLRPVPRARRA